MTIGLDEVGRGCWAGPLVAGAVLLPPGFEKKLGNIRLRDSKKLSKKQREQAATWIRDYALAVSTGWVSPAEVDSLGLTEAVRLAMSRALQQITLSYDEIIVDGNINYFADNPKARAVIKADDTVPAVSAASIVAKVARDTYMCMLGDNYAHYGFESHVGYGTAEHIAALQQYGASDIHRMSYKPVQSSLAT